MLFPKCQLSPVIITILATPSTVLLAHVTDMTAMARKMSTYKACKICLGVMLIPGKLTLRVSPLRKSESFTTPAKAIFRMTVDTLVMYTGMLSSIASSGPEAMGSSDGWPWRGSRMRPEMKDDAAVEGYCISSPIHCEVSCIRER